MDLGKTDLRDCCSMDKGKAVSGDCHNTVRKAAHFRTGLTSAETPDARTGLASAKGLRLGPAQRQEAAGSQSLA